MKATKTKYGVFCEESQQYLGVPTNRSIYDEWTPDWTRAKTFSSYKVAARKAAELPIGSIIEFKQEWTLVGRVPQESDCYIKFKVNLEQDKAEFARLHQLSDSEITEAQDRRYRELKLELKEDLSEKDWTIFYKSL